MLRSYRLKRKLRRAEALIRESKYLAALMGRRKVWGKLQRAKNLIQEALKL